MTWGKTTFDCEWSDDTDFEKLPSVNDVHGYVFDDKNDLCVVKWKGDKYWGDLGGRVEKGDKSYQDTFIREVEEEADLELKDIKRLGYVKYIECGKNKEKYGVKFIARVKKIKPQTIDPAEGEIPKRKFIKPRDFANRSNWGEQGNFEIEKALKKLKER